MINLIAVNVVHCRPMFYCCIWVLLHACLTEQTSSRLPNKSCGSANMSCPSTCTCLSGSMKH